MSEFPTATTTEDFRRNLALVEQRIADACARAGRERSQVRLLPVSKTVDEPRLRAAIAAGMHGVGENKVQEAKAKAAALADIPDLSWSVIGHLQTNKAKDVVAFADEFQALDSLRLAESLDRRLQAAGRGLDVFVQVNTSDEESKYGLPPEQVADVLAALPQFTSLRMRGLMTLAVFSPDTEAVRACFVRLRVLRDRLRERFDGLDELSMGMSGDYPLAIEEGATVVRVGQAIFGRRATPDALYWPADGV
ncbi:MAG: YggS family pyridoxal phosphate-dependent enzyme [Propionibacteriaceae bacterium]|nr:YggS family pyridoxal phosphate-dependent enzyme [Propionibacteriaceae bacterium]